MVRPYDSHEGRTRADAASAVRPYHFLKTRKPAPAIVKRMIVAMELLSVAVRLAHNGVGHARTNTADMGRLPLLYTVVGQKERLRIKGAPLRRWRGGRCLAFGNASHAAAAPYCSAAGQFVREP